MDFMNLYFGLKLLVIGLLVGAALILLIIGQCLVFFRWYKKRKAQGWCKHEFKLSRTNSFGPKAWYKCTKCGEEELR